MTVLAKINSGVVTLSNRKINGCLITPSVSMGGAERWMLDIVSRADKINWKSAVLTDITRYDPIIVSELHKYVPLYGYETADAEEFCLDRLTYKSEHLNEIINAGTTGCDIALLWGGTNYFNYLDGVNIPMIICSHCTAKEDNLAPISDNITHFTAVSEEAAKYFVGRGKEVKVDVIHNGADPKRCKPTKTKEQMREFWDIPQSATVIGYVGRFSEEKNPLATLRAVKQLVGSGVDAYAVYYGCGPLRDNIIDWGDKILWNRYRVHDPIDNIGDIFEGIDLLMLVSHREAFSMVLIESWLAGCPVLASDKAVASEVERKFGPLTTKIDPPRGLSNAIDYVAPITQAMANKDKTRRAQFVASRHFTADVMVSRWENHILSVVEES